MISLIKLYEEIKNKDIIGKGAHGNVYNINSKPNQVVKKLRSGDIEDELKYYKLFNQFPDLFVHIYKLTSTYVIMEKVDMNIGQGKVLDFIEKIGSKWIDEDPLTEIYQSIRKNDLKEFNFILEKAKELNENEVYLTLKEWFNYLIKLNKQFSEFLDVHVGNIGKDKNNKLKIFDVSISL